MNFYNPKSEPVEPNATKYDECTMRATGMPYRFQKGSGRAEIINRFVTDGKTVGEVVRDAAAAGFEPVFTIGALFRQHDTKDGAWKITPPDGVTLEDIKGSTTTRALSPEAEEKRAQREAAKAEKAASREARKIEAEARRLEREKARAERNEAAAARRAAKAASTAPEDGPTPNPVVKGRGGRRKAPTPEAGEIVNEVVEVV